MAHTTWLERDLGDGEYVEIEVEFTLTGGSPESGMSGPPEHYDPGSAPELEIDRAWRDDTKERVKLTDSEVREVTNDVMGRLGDFEDVDGYELL